MPHHPCVRAHDQPCQPACHANTRAMLAKAVQSVGRRYVQYFNSIYGRTGTLWKGRYRATLVHAEDYLLTCMHSIGLNPVRAGMVQHPVGYPWSSYRVNAQGEDDALITPHELYRRLARSAQEPLSVYRQLVSGFGRRFRRRIWKPFATRSTRVGQWATTGSGRRSSACLAGAQHPFPEAARLRLKWSLTHLSAHLECWLRDPTQRGVAVSNI